LPYHPGNTSQLVKLQDTQAFTERLIKRYIDGRYQRLVFAVKADPYFGDRAIKNFLSRIRRLDGY